MHMLILHHPNLLGWVGSEDVEISHALEGATI